MDDLREIRITQNNGRMSTLTLDADAPVNCADMETLARQISECGLVYETNYCGDMFRGGGKVN